MKTAAIACALTLLACGVSPSKQGQVGGERTVAGAESVWQSSCAFQDADTLTLDASSFDRLIVRAGPGGLVIRGRPDFPAVEVQGIKCASRRDVLEGLHLEARSEERTAYVDVGIPSELFSPQVGTVAKIELSIAVPKGLDLEVQDGSGNVELYEVGSTRLESDLGDIRAVGLVGTLRISGGPGSLVIHGHEGDVWIDAKPGAVQVAEIDGSVVVAEEHVGDITVRDVTGSVNLERGQAGDVSVDGVLGDLTVGAMRRGKLEYKNIQGTVSTAPAEQGTPPPDSQGHPKERV